jgi:AraC-like DNA-binding protein
MKNVSLSWLERASNSDFVTSVWACYAREETTRPVLPDPCITVALVREGQNLQVVIRGAETKARNELLVLGYTCTAVRLRPGILLRDFPAQKFVNGSLRLPADATWRFWLGDDQLQFPNFTTAERLIDQLCNLGYLRHGVSDDNEAHITKGLSARSHARLVKRTTGLSPHKLHQLERIHQALRLLKEGTPATAVTAELGFVDQSHLTHASKQLLGYTPKQLKQLPHVPQIR